jgi:hypothetical protein
MANFCRQITRRWRVAERELGLGAASLAVFKGADSAFNFEL